MTGTLAVFSSELEWLAEPLLRAQPGAPATHEPFSWQSTYEAITETHPQAAVAILVRPDGNRSAAGGVIAFRPRDFRLAIVDPHSYAVTGQRSTFGLSSFLRILHKQFYIVPGIFGVHGIWVVGLAGVFLLASAITGLLSVKRWLRALVTLRAGRSKRLFISDLHRMSGLWAIPLTALFALTGIWYLAENILISAELMVEESGPASTVESTGQFPVRPLVDLDFAARAAEDALPGFTASRVFLPRRQDAPLVFQGQADAFLVRDRANQVEVDPYTGAVLHVRRGTDLALLPRWVETADPLHFGTFGGVATQVIWLVAGLALCASVLTGLYGAWMRLAKENHLPARPFFSIAVVLPSLTVLAAATIGTTLFGGFQWIRAHDDIERHILARNAGIGPWTVTVSRDERESGAEYWFDIKFHGGYPALGETRLYIAEAGSPHAAEPSGADSRVRRFADRIWASVPRPGAECDEGCALHLVLKDPAGRSHRAAFPISHSPIGESVSVPKAVSMAPGEIALFATSVVLLLLPFAGWSALQFRRRGATAR